MSRIALESAFPGFNWAKADLDREFRSILAQARQFQLRSHRADTWLGGIVGPMSLMSLAESLWDQDVNRTTEYLFPLIPKYLFRLGVNDDDFTRFVYYNHCVRCEVQ